MDQQDNMAARQLKIAGLKAAARGAAPKKAASKSTAPAKKIAVGKARAAQPSKAAVMLNDLRPAVAALHDRVEKLRLRFA